MAFHILYCSVTHTHTETEQQQEHNQNTQIMEVENEMRQSKFRRICVFCGSSQGRKSSYQDAAIDLGNQLVFFFFFFFFFFNLFLSISMLCFSSLLSGIIWLCFCPKMVVSVLSISILIPLFSVITCQSKPPFYLSFLLFLFLPIFWNFPILFLMWVSLF